MPWSGTKKASKEKEKGDSDVEFSFEEVSKSLDKIQSDINEVKHDLKKTVKDDKLEALVTNIIKNLLKENNKEQETIIKTEVDKRCKLIEENYNKKIERMYQNIEALEGKVENLTEKLHECKKELRESKQLQEETQQISVEALRRSNYNEQYSRKHNFKIMGLPEDKKENTWKLAKNFIEENAEVELHDHEIVAIHRIPGEAGKHRPILVKVLNTDVKARVMRKRSTIKAMGNGLKLVDDVTRANAELINQLLQFQEIESAWYFNGAVYGAVHGKHKNNKNKRIKFDITDDIKAKLRKFKDHSGKNIPEDE